MDGFSLVILYFSFLWQFSLQSLVYIEIFEQGMNCSSNSLLYAKKVGELTCECRETEVPGPKTYFGRYLCKQDEGKFVLDLYLNKNCSGDIVLTIPVDIYPNCTEYEPHDEFDVQGSCFYQYPTSQVHVQFFMDEKCLMDHREMDIVFNPSKCQDGDFPDIQSAQFTCDNGVAIFESFNSKGCIDGEEVTRMEKGQCFSLDSSKKNFFSKIFKSVFKTNDDPASIMMVEYCSN